jgi:hypothetical protein
MSALLLLLTFPSCRCLRRNPEVCVDIAINPLQSVMDEPSSLLNFETLELADLCNPWGISLRLTM